MSCVGLWAITASGARHLCGIRTRVIPAKPLKSWRLRRHTAAGLPTAGPMQRKSNSRNSLREKNVRYCGAIGWVSGTIFELG